MSKDVMAVGAVITSACTVASYVDRQEERLLIPFQRAAAIVLKSISVSLQFYNLAQ